MARTPKEYQCRVCGNTYQSKSDIERHFQETHTNVKFRCRACGATFKSPRTYYLHQRKTHNLEGRHHCTFCFRMFRTKSLLDEHVAEQHLGDGAGSLRLVRSALSNSIRQYSASLNPRQVTSAEAAAGRFLDDIVELIEMELRTHHTLRQSLIVSGRFLKAVAGESGVTFRREIFPARVRSRLVLESDRRDLTHILEQQFADAATRLDMIANEESGWVLQDIAAVDVELSHATVLRGASLDAASVSAAREALSSMPNCGRLQVLTTDRDDEKFKCFYYAVAFGLMSKDGYEPGEEVLRHFIAQSFKDVRNQPVSIEEVKKFERKNSLLKFKIQIISFRRSTREHYVAYRSKKKAEGRTLINLFLLPPSRGVPEGHYFFIKPPIAPFINKKGRPKLRCENCYQILSNITEAERHEALCYRNKRQRVQYPKPGEFLHFKSFHRLHKIPFIGFLDFESALQPEERDVGNATRLLNCHKPVSFSFLVVDVENRPVFEHYEAVQSDNEDIMEACMNMIIGLNDKMKPLLKRYRPMLITSEEVDQFNGETRCYACQRPFPPGQKVRDHCHLSGRYRGAACVNCNLLMYQVKDFPIFVHNLVNYDGIFITAALKHVSKDRRLSAIPKNTEKLKTVSIENIKFLDSLEFLRGSLKELVDLARKDSLPMFRLLFDLGLCKSEQERDLLLMKGVFPYDYCRSIDVINRTLELPSQDDFYNALTQSHLSDDDYRHAQNVFKTFQCRGMGDYLKLYNRLDTALLCIAFQSYRNHIYADFGLDPAHYISTPMLAMDCFLKSSRISIELIHESDICLLAMNNIRGGLSQVNIRHVSIAEDEDREHLLYIDANNLYGFAMSQPLPLGDYRLITAEEASSIDWRLLEAESEIGYLVEVDLDYPAHLHAQHRHLPLFFGNREVNFDMLSPYSRRCLDSLRKSTRYSQTKLCADFLPKRKVAVHYLNLKFYLSMGLEVRKIYCAVRFRQKAYIKPHIELIAEKRKKAENDFAKRNLKLCANSLYGKFLQNDRYHRRVRFVNDAAKAKVVMGRPEYAAHKIISEDLVAVFLEKKNVKLNKCYLVGVSILELSKLHMLQSFYREILPRLGADNMELVLTDTDSFILHVKNWKRENMLTALSPIMDFSNYPPDNPHYSCNNKGRLGFFKDESAGGVMKEVVALRSKCYITRTRQDDKSLHDDSRCKGVDHHAQSQLTLQQYKDCLYKKREVGATIRNIQVANGKLYTTETNKIALTPFDDKRFIKNCGLHTAPYSALSVDEHCSLCVENGFSQEEVV